MMWDRRDALKLFLWAGAAASLPRQALAVANEVPTFTLDNGMRLHFVPTGARYVSAALVLRSKEIFGRGGLAHILEHTSFTGAAGPLSAKDVKLRHRDCIQDSNASTTPGMIEWRAAFLPKYLPDVLELLAYISLEQKFDVETVASEARIVLQELYLDKYGSDGGLKKRYSAALFGSDHPFALDTTDEEIAKARTEPAKLAAELRDYSTLIRLPANLDLFVVGDIERVPMEKLVSASFGRYPFAKGPYLELPNAGPTRAHRALSGMSPELKQPLSEVKVAWNTGVRITDPEARTLLALSEYLNDVLFAELREKHGDTYSPGARYEPDSCSGIFTISVTSSKRPSQVEERIFETIEKLKREVDASGLIRFQERLLLKRLKTLESSDARLDAIIDRVTDGGSVEDFDLASVSPEDVVAAGRKYLPTYQGAYVRAVLKGK